MLRSHGLLSSRTNYVSPVMSVSIMRPGSFDQPTLNNTQAITPLATAQKIGRSCFVPVADWLQIRISLPSGPWCIATVARRRIK